MTPAGEGTNDGPSPGEDFFPVMPAEFGALRTVQLLGWCLLIGAITGEEDTTAQVRERLRQLGLTRHSTSRALRDINRLVFRLAQKHGPTSILKVLQGMRQSGSATIARHCEERQILRRRQ